LPKKEGASATSVAPAIYHVLMDTSSDTAQDHLRKAIDDEVQELKYHRNALAPISRLPPETLAEIFSLLSFSADDSESVPYLAWIRVTHVCHRWHEIAIYSPYLWSHINFTRGDTCWSHRDTRPGKDVALTLRGRRYHPFEQGTVQCLR